MDKKRVLLILQAISCIALSAALAVSAIHIYLEGAAFRAAGNATAWIYTREKAAAAIGRFWWLFALCALITVLCIVFGARDENQDRPVKEPKEYTGPKTLPDPGRQKIVRLVVLAAALIMIVAGIFNGSMHDVLMKAIMICTECVGLG